MSQHRCHSGNGGYISWRPMCRSAAASFCFFLWDSAGWVHRVSLPARGFTLVWHLGLAPRDPRPARDILEAESFDSFEFVSVSMSCPSRLGIDTDLLQSCENGIDAKGEGLRKIIECQGIKKYLWIEIAHVLFIMYTITLAFLLQL